MQKLDRVRRAGWLGLDFSVSFGRTGVQKEGRRVFLLVPVVILPCCPEHSSGEFRSVNLICSLCSLPAAIFSLV